MAADEPMTDLSPEMRALQKKLNEGWELGRQLAVRLSYNLTHNVDIDRRILPERPKTFMEKPDLLSLADAWRLSPAGHVALANAAYQIVRDHAEFLG